MKFFYPLVWIVENIKKAFSCRTWHVEQSFTVIVLVVVALVSGSEPVEWIGVGAVYLTFGYTLISDRLEEAERARHARGETPEVECYGKLRWYFYGKEILWTLYFIFLGAWSALVGVGLFVLYPYWRKLWRKYHPRKVIQREETPVVTPTKH